MPARKSLVIVALLLPFTCTRADEPRLEFAKTARDIRQGIFLVGNTGVGTGTAWVISKKHRLLVTNAHVADMFSKAPPGKVLAMMNNSGQTYVVIKAWYHPGVKRYATKDENLSVRASNPQFGDVDPLSPDVAILQLSAAGPDLPVELKIAGPKVVFDLQALPVAILGYPGHDTFAWPGPGKKAQATFHVGVISRVTDFQLDGGAKDELAQLLQYTMESWNGFSGSPVFLANGEVVGAHNMSRTVDAKGTRKIAHGIRADSLWELLVHHKLEDRVSVPVAGDKLLLKRWSDPDPNIDLWQKLAKLIEDANFLIYTRLDYAGGIAKCEEAIRLFPRYAPAYRSRSDAYTGWFFRHGNADNWSREKQFEILNKARVDANQFADLHRVKTLETFLLGIPILNNLSYITRDKKYSQQALDDCHAILKLKDLTTTDRAWTISCKAVALAGLGKREEARQTYSQALELDVDHVSIWEARASFFEHNNNENLGRLDRAVARGLRKKTLLLKNSAKKDWKVVSEVKERLTKDDPPDGQGCHRQSWSVDLEEGYFYQIELKNPEFKNAKDYDPVLRLTDDKGKVLAEDDDGGGFPNSRIFYTAGRSAKYNLIVTSFEPGQTGPFVLTVTRVAKDE